MNVTKQSRFVMHLLMKEYTEYLYLSEFIKDFTQSLKKKNPAFSIRSFAKKLQYANSSLIQDVLKKKRKPTPELVMKMAKAFRLHRHQKDYLLKICELERAKSFSERDQIMMDLRSLLAERTWKFYDFKQFDFLNYSYINLIFALVAVKGFRPEMDYIKKNLRIEITEQMLSHAMKVLVESGYIQKTSKGDYVYCHKNVVLTYGEDMIEKQMIIKYHLSTMQQIQKIYPDVEREKRDVRTTVMAIKKSDFSAITDELKKVHQKISIYGVDEAGEDAYIFSTQFVPIMKNLK